MRKFISGTALAGLLILAACGEAEVAQNDSAPPMAIAVADGLEFTIKSVKTVEEVSRNQTFTAAPGETFVVVRYTVKNVSDQVIKARDTSKLILRDEKGRRQERDNSLSVWTTDETEADLNPDLSGPRTDIWRVASATYNPSTWLLVAETKPELTFKLQ